MRPDPDTDNSSAGEVSTTDSGRGPSEEGENSIGSMQPVLGMYTYLFIYTWDMSFFALKYKNCIRVMINNNTIIIL